MKRILQFLICAAFCIKDPNKSTNNKDKPTNNKILAIKKPKYLFDNIKAVPEKPGILGKLRKEPLTTIYEYRAIRYSVLTALTIGVIYIFRGSYTKSTWNLCTQTVRMPLMIIMHTPSPLAPYLVPGSILIVFMIYEPSKRAAIKLIRPFIKEYRDIWEQSARNVNIINKFDKRDSIKLELYDEKTTKELESISERAHNNMPMQSIILYGKPGTGKTMIPRDMANKLNGHNVLVSSMEAKIFNSPGVATNIMDKFIIDIIELLREKLVIITVDDELFKQRNMKENLTNDNDELLLKLRFDDNLYKAIQNEKDKSENLYPLIIARTTNMDFSKNATGPMAIKLDSALQDRITACIQINPLNTDQKIHAIENHIMSVSKDIQLQNKITVPTNINKDDLRSLIESSSTSIRRLKSIIDQLLYDKICNPNIDPIKYINNKIESDS